MDILYTILNGCGGCETIYDLLENFIKSILRVLGFCVCKAHLGQFTCLYKIFGGWPNVSMVFN